MRLKSSHGICYNKNHVLCYILGVYVNFITVKKRETEIRKTKATFNKSIRHDLAESDAARNHA